MIFSLKARLCLYYMHRADSRFTPSQWETGLLCNTVSHWLGESLESTLYAASIIAGDYWDNTLRARQNGQYIADNIFSCIFFNENSYIVILISLKSGNKPLAEPILACFFRHSASMSQVRSRGWFTKPIHQLFFPNFPHHENSTYWKINAYNNLYNCYINLLPIQFCETWV